MIAITESGSVYEIEVGETEGRCEGRIRKGLGDWEDCILVSGPHLGQRMVIALAPYEEGHIRTTTRVRSIA